MDVLSRIVVLGLVGGIAGGCRAAERASQPPEAPISVHDVGFATPESVLHDAAADVYLVSNINGSPLEADDNGFISRVTPEGQVLELKWIDGRAENVTLNAPKGMAIVGDVLYVTDITTVRMFDRTTGAPRGQILVAGSSFLNDLAAGSDGSVYLTDSGLKAGAQGFEPSGTDAVYRISTQGTVEQIARGDELGRPNGLAVAGDDLWVVTFGSGELYRLDSGIRMDTVKLPKGSLDGIERVGDQLLVSSWEGQAVYLGTPSGPFTAVVSGVEAPADIGHDAKRHRVLIPLFTANEVRIVPLPRSSGATSL